MFKTKHIRPRQYLLCMIVGAICAASLNIKSGKAAEPTDMTAEKLLDICTSSTAQIAGKKGDVLGWQKMTGAEKDELRDALIGYNPDSVEIVGWQNKTIGLPDVLWFATRTLRLKLCSYSSRNAAGLLDGLSKHLGTPERLERDNTAKSITASWSKNSLEYDFFQARSSAIVTIGSQR
ncbi:hypothetical protein [Ochrobactrum sp. MYb379]|uniref:hypothetical protein n=1 Tax=Ochrobactrum sp. MYb379 TaxID=2745275 RepID=UPI0030D946C6